MSSDDVGKTSARPEMPPAEKLKRAGEAWQELRECEGRLRSVRKEAQRAYAAEIETVSQLVSVYCDDGQYGTVEECESRYDRARFAAFGKAGDEDRAIAEYDRLAEAFEEAVVEMQQLQPQPEPLEGSGKRQDRPGEPGPLRAEKKLWQARQAAAGTERAALKAEARARDARRGADGPMLKEYKSPFAYAMPNALVVEEEQALLEARHARSAAEEKAEELEKLE